MARAQRLLSFFFINSGPPCDRYRLASPRPAPHAVGDRHMFPPASINVRRQGCVGLLRVKNAGYGGSCHPCAWPVMAVYVKWDRSLAAWLEGSSPRIAASCAYSFFISALPLTGFGVGARRGIPGEGRGVWVGRGFFFCRCAGKGGPSITIPRPGPALLLLTG